MFKSEIIVTEPSIQIINYEKFGLEYIDLRDKTEYELYKILPSLMYNYLIILKLDERVTHHLNTYGIGFTQVYQRDSEMDLYSSTLDYYSNKIKLKETTLNYITYHTYIMESRNNLWASGWNACADYVRRQVKYKELEND